MSGWQSAARSETGKVRQRNEDALLAATDQGLWAIADGMGGHANGALASRSIIEGLSALQLNGTLEQRIAQVRTELVGLNQRLSQDLTLAADQQDSIMGSTVVVLLVEGGRGACLWAGDSRCYLWRDQRLFQLTRDHSLAQQLIDRHRYSAEQAAQHPASQALTRAVGATNDLELDTVEFDVRPGDCFLLCSDGIHQASPAAVLGAALKAPTPKRAADLLIDFVMQGPARDNLSAVVVRKMPSGVRQ